MKKISTNLLTTIIAVGVAVVLVVAMFVPTIITLTKNNKEVDALDAQIAELKEQLEALKGADTLTDEDVATAISDALAKLEIPEAGLTEAQVKAIVDAAIGALVIPEAGLSEAQVKAIVDAAIAALVIPEAGLSKEEVEKIVADAIKGVDTGLTEAEINKLIADAIAKIEIPEAGLTAEEVNKLIADAIAKIEIPEAGLTAEEVNKLIADAIAKIEIPEAGLSEAQVKAIVDAAIAALDIPAPGLTEAEVEAIVKEILANQVADLKSGLETGGNFSLTSNVTLDEVTVPAGVTSTLNLNGYTLTVGGEWKVLGTLNVNNGKIVTNIPEKEEDLYLKAGLNTIEGGTLALDNVDIEGNRVWNVLNEGALTLTNSDITAVGGFAVANYGTATIKNCSFIANGVNGTPFYSYGGTTVIESCDFTEGSFFTGYYEEDAPIEVHKSDLTLIDVTINVAPEAEGNPVKYAVMASSSAVTVKSGSLNAKFLCVGDETSIAIYGGTIAGIDFANITTTSPIFDGAYFKLSYDDVAKCWTISK